MSKFLNVLKGRCPRCEKGLVFASPNPYNLRKMFSTNRECTNCHLNFVPEVGFYWGATYVAYGITVAFSGLNFVISTLIFGFMNSLNLTFVAVNGLLLFLLYPVFYRLSRMLWLWMAY